MSQDLKPCPFCGGTDIALGRDEDVCWNQCRRCEASGPTMRKYDGDDEPEWNTRPLQAEGAPASKIANAYYDGAMAALGCDWWGDGADFFALVGQDYAAGKPLPTTMPKRREGAPAAEGDRFWLILHEPGCVPERKGPWCQTKGEVQRVLREFMAARPTAYIDVLTLHHDGPDVQHGPELLQMLDGRSMARGRRHNAQARNAHAEHHAALSPPAAEGKEDARNHPSRVAIERAVINSSVLREFGLSYRQAIASDVATDVIVDALSHTPAPAAEPVAWMVSGAGAAMLMHNEPTNGVAPGLTVTPLYASPPQQPVEISREELKTDLTYARALLTESIQGSAARSPNHNARLVIDFILSKLSGYPLVEEKQQVAAGVEASGDGSLPVPSDPPRSAGGEA